MCGRFTIVKKVAEIEERFSVKIQGGLFDEIYNAAPGQKLPVIAGDDKSTVQFFKWGLVPFWAKDAAIGNKMINARAETILEKPSFRNIFSRKRCLVIADGFYEWKLAAGRKQPYRIMLKSGELFAFAGLWDEWKNKDNENLFSFTIITTAANEMMRDIHERMPVILNREMENLWLAAETSKDELYAMLKPYNAQQMMAYPVSTAVNNTRINTPELIHSLQYTANGYNLSFPGRQISCSNKLS
jgi:putative SOS response-associated peptidase YedK